MIAAGAIFATIPCISPAAEKHSPAVKAKIEAARKASRSGDIATERRLLEEALKEEPQSTQILRGLADVASSECRWPDGLLLLKQARDLTRKKDDLREVDERMIWLNTARLHASPDVYCGSPFLIKNPVPITQVKPAMPAAATLRRGRTTVRILTEISPAGIPENSQALPTGELGEYAVEALKAAAQWRFHPGTRDGKPVRLLTNIEVNFIVPDP